MKLKTTMIVCAISLTTSSYTMRRQTEDYLEKLVKQIVGPREKPSISKLELALEELKKIKIEPSEEIKKQLTIVEEHLKKEREEIHSYILQTDDDLYGNPIAGGVFMDPKEVASNLCNSIHEMNLKYKKIKNVQRLCLKLLSEHFEEETKKVEEEIKL